MKKKLRQLVKKYLVSGIPVEPLGNIIPPKEIKKVARTLSPAQWKARGANQHRLREYAIKPMGPTVSDGPAVSRHSSSA